MAGRGLSFALRGSSLAASLVSCLSRRSTLHHHTKTQAWMGLRGMCEKAGGFQRQPGRNAGEQAERKPVDSQAKMGIAFTCTECETRVTRFFSKVSYERGVVIIKVEKEDGCKSNKGNCLHLIADNLGWFEDDPVNIETLAARRGEVVRRASVSSAADGSAQVKGDEGGQIQIVVEENEGTMEYRPEEPVPTQLLK